MKSYTRALSLVLGVLVTGCAAPEEEEADTSNAAVSEGSRPFRPQMADASSWAWHTRQAKDDACTLSVAARATYDATVEARNHVVLPDDLVLSKRNVAGPAFLSAGEMFPALAALIAEAKYEVDIGFAMNDVDSDPWHDVIGGLQRLYARLASDKSGAERDPFVLRIILPHWFGDGNVQKVASYIGAHLGPIDPSVMRVEIAAHKQVALGIMHVKLAVIDGVVVHAGGGNLTHHQNYQDNAPHEQDSAYVVKGAIGKSALAHFDDLWNDNATTAFDCSTADMTCTRMRAKPRLAVAKPGVEGSGHVPEVADPDLTRAGIPEDACLPMIFMAKKSTRNPFTGDTNNPIGRGFRAAFESSRSVLRVSTPNLNSKWAEMVERIVRARTTQVRLILPQTFNDTMMFVPFFGGGTNRKTIKWMSKKVGGENIGIGKTLDARWFSIDGRTIQRGGWETGGRHIKYYSVDDTLAIIGSSNLDKQTMSRAREIGIAVDDPTVTARWDAKIFDQDFARAISVDPNALPDTSLDTPDETMDDAPPEVQEEFAKGL